MGVADTTLAAMGTTARFFLWHPPAELENALQARLGELEDQWSRFLDTSEISAVNARAGEPVRVGADTILLVERALTASRLTHGWFDPTLLVELTACGYDRTFAELATSGLGDLIITLDHSAGGDQVQVHDWTALSRSVKVDGRANTVTLAAGTGFDPGGIGKGLAADLLAAQALEAGASAVLIDIGGDIVAAGVPPEGGWPINIEDPFDRESALCGLNIPWGAVATSSRSKRRWVHDGVEQHHLLDPGTRCPSNSNVASATVVAGECWLAEAYAKAALLAGTDVGLELLTKAGVEGLIVDRDGHQLLTDGMVRFIQ